jgi:hypothetical protein
MALKQELLTALQNGATHTAVLEILRVHRSELIEPKAAYGILEQIWLELGFDDSDEQSQLRNELECALEKTWYSTTTTGPQSGVSR